MLSAALILSLSAVTPSAWTGARASLPTPAPPARVAQSGRGAGEWIQLTFEGQVVGTGGARIELAVEALRSDQSVRVSLEPHLAEATSASDVAALLARRLERAGIFAWVTETDGSMRRHVFVEHVLGVRCRMSPGLSATVTVCEGAPDSLRIEPPDIVQGPARLRVTYSTLHPHTGVRGQQELEMPLTPDMHAARISEALTRQCLDDGLVAERPQQDSWRLVKLGDGAGLVGFNVELDTAADWALELLFAR